jgi:hypothetical protein
MEEIKKMFKKIVLLVLLTVFLCTGMAFGQEVIYERSETIYISGTQMYSFEDDVNGWQPQTWLDSQAITSITHDNTKAYLGSGSIRAAVELIPGNENKSKGEVGVNMTESPPSKASTLPPYDLSNAIVTVAIWLPSSAAGSPTAPNGIQMFFKDSGWKAKCSHWMNITEIPTDQWYQISIDMANEVWGWDGGADLTDVTSVGIKIGTNEVPGAQGFTGDIWIDSFTWTPPGMAFKGVSYVAWTPDEYTYPSSDASLYRLKTTGANYVALLVTQYMDSGTSNTIYADPSKTPNDDAVVHAISDIHSYGMKVLLKPYVDCKDGTWRGVIDPSDKEMWFSSYSNFINHYAEIAQNNGVELLCVGTEFKSLSGSAYQSNWSDVISVVRSIYTGPITYAANWDEYKNVSFWDLVNYAGIDAYFPLSDLQSPSVDDLMTG